MSFICFPVLQKWHQRVHIVLLNVCIVQQPYQYVILFHPYIEVHSANVTNEHLDTSLEIPQVLLEYSSAYLLVHIPLQMSALCLSL